MAEDVFDIVGTVVGGAFNVEAVVAEGGFAVVYRAYHAAFHAPVALKCLKVPTVRRVDQREFLERFREEGEVLFRLSQSIPSVVRPLHVDAFETAQGVFVPYMALEWLDGETLDVVVARRRADGLHPMSPKRVVRLLTPVARALQRAHNFPAKDGPISIIHRDLKPDNIVIATVNNEEVVKILDFGIAKVKSVASQVAGRQSQDNADGAVPFTPGYAAPEQWFPRRYGQTGPWTDVWGLALCAVESMSGKAAIDGDHAAMMGTAVDERRRPTPGSEGVRVPDEVEDVFLKALAVDPRHRSSDIGSFWDALEFSLGLPSSKALAGMGQGYGDSRSDGTPALMEERVEAAEVRYRRSVRPSGGRMSSDQKSAVTPRERASLDVDMPMDGFVPAFEVPDLDFDTQSLPREIEEEELEVDLQQEAKRVEEFVRPKPPPPPVLPTKPENDQELELSPEIVSEIVPEIVAEKPTKKPAEVNLPGVEHGFGGGLLPMDNKSLVGAEPSGIDLAVSPQDMRRVSSTAMRAVRPPAPEDVLPLGQPKIPSSPPASRSGTHRLSTSSASSALPTTLPEVGSSKLRRFGLPIALASIGILIALAYYVNASMGGGRWALGPVPVNWIAALLTVAGSGMLLIRLFWPEE